VLSLPIPIFDGRVEIEQTGSVFHVSSAYRLLNVEKKKKKKEVRLCRLKLLVAGKYSGLRSFVSGQLRFSGVDGGPFLNTLTPNFSAGWPM
jgi:hypothetical protein